MALIGLVFAVYKIQSYKKSIHNTFDSALIFILAAFYVSHGDVTVTEFASINRYFLPSMGLTLQFFLLWSVWVMQCGGL